MTTEHHASRTLVKSPPELWAECSDAASLARHIGEFGEIRITRLEPETSVAWEGELATGTVNIEPSGWGTRVTLTVQTAGEDVVDGDTAVVVAAAGEDVAQANEAVVVEQDAAQQPADPQITEAESVEEEAHETVEATVAQPDPALAADPTPVDGRWKRLITRTRGWFKPRADESEPVVESGSVPAVETDSVSPPETSVPPPETSVPPPEPTATVAEQSTPDCDPQPVEGEGAPDCEPSGASPPALDPDAILTAALDSLGQAHHRPFSRA